MARPGRSRSLQGSWFWFALLPFLLIPSRRAPCWESLPWCPCASPSSHQARSKAHLELHVSHVELGAMWFFNDTKTYIHCICATWIDDDKMKGQNMFYDRWWCFICGDRGGKQKHHPPTPNQKLSFHHLFLQSPVHGAQYLRLLPPFPLFPFNHLPPWCLPCRSLSHQRPLECLLSSVLPPPLSGCLILTLSKRLHKMQLARMWYYLSSLLRNGR